MVATAGSGKKSLRLFVHDSKSGLKFFDTGSEVSVLSPNQDEKNTLNLRYQLVTANASKIKTYAIKKLVLDIGLAKEYTWNFLVADVSVPIIDADMLVAFGLIPDLQSKRILDKLTFVSTVCSEIECSQSSIYMIALKTGIDSIVEQMLMEFPNLLKPPQYLATAPHDVEHYIETSNAAPIYEKPRRLKPQTNQKIKNAFKEMKSTGLVTQSKLQWASPIIQEREGKDMRIIGDYRKLNSVAVPD